MPSHPGAFIQTEKGTRHLQNDELAGGLGVPEKGRISLLSPYTSSGTPPACSTGNISKTVVSQVRPRPSSSLPQADLVAQGIKGIATDLPPFEWRPSDLAEGGVWHQRPVASLREAVASYPEPADLFTEGLEILRIHRGNYDEAGPNPTRLQILWWQWPLLSFELERGRPHKGTAAATVVFASHFVAAPTQRFTSTGSFRSARVRSLFPPSPAASSRGRVVVIVFERRPTARPTTVPFSPPFVVSKGAGRVAVINA